MSASASAIADRYIGKDGGAPMRPRWKRSGRIAGQIVSADSEEDVRRVAYLLNRYALRASDTGDRLDAIEAFDAFARLIGVTSENLLREVEKPS